jgi:hypothetical protein
MVLVDQQNHERRGVRLSDKAGPLISGSISREDPHTVGGERLCQGLICS